MVEVKMRGKGGMQACRIFCVGEHFYAIHLVVHAKLHNNRLTLNKPLCNVGSNSDPAACTHCVTASDNLGFIRRIYSSALALFF